MRRKGIQVLLTLVIALAVPQLGWAEPVHNFDCNNCHLAGLTINELGGANVCLQCHGATPSATTTYIRGSVTSDGGFATGDASNHFNNNPAPAAETSHNWAASNSNPAAGSSEPVRATYPGFYSRYGTTTGKVACSRCHNPHSDIATNPKLLPLKSDATPMAVNDMCLACHKSFGDAMQGNLGLLSHPMITDYATFQAANSTDYLGGIPAYDPANPYANNVQLVDGNITCLSCHNLHFTDSDDTTTDGPTQSLNQGDGQLLRGNGAQFTVNKGGTDFPTGGSICIACHNYGSGLHGENGGAKDIGCLACHGGHNYNDGDPTYYMLNDTTGAYSGAAPPATAAERNVAWVGTEGVVDGFCETCHGDITTWTAAGSGADGGPVDRDHDFATDMATGCDQCHQTHSEGAFSEAAGCTDCHGWPPNVNLAGGPNGYADATLNFGGFPPTTYNYQTNNGGITFLNEANTGHSTHAAGGLDEYNFSCGECHKGNTHNDANGGANDNPTFQDVFIDTTGVIANTVTLGGGPAYAGGSNDCSNVYCHSDGVNPDRVIAGPNAAVVPNWDTAVDGTTTCTSCHNTGTTGTATVHNTHLALTLDGASVTCGTCHDATWESTDNLKNNADTSIVAAHVDGDVDVVFNTTLTPTAPMDQVNGTCAVYCHSNGTAPVQVPDWDDATTGDCGDCHAIASGNGLSAAHDTHLDEGFGCNDCHTHDGSAFGGDHINGTKDVTANVCNTCHGSTVAGTGVDAEPVFTDPNSVTCNTCHQGTLATIGGNTAPDATAINPLGNAHGIAGYDCNTCHDIATADALHLDGTQGNTDRLSYASSDAACNDCHGDGATTSTINGINTHQAKTCATCHDPHYGGSNLSLVRGTSADYSGTVVFTATTGADSYDEDDGAAGGAGEVNADDICATCHSLAGGTTHNNRDNSAVNHNQGTDCFSCHKAHTDDTAPFGMGAGTNCGDCHAYAAGTAQGALTSGAHAAHITVVDGDLTNEDLSDCAKCHGAAVLGYNYAPGGAHMDSNFDFTAGLGYDDNGTRGNTADDLVTTCAGACHSTAAGQAADWLTTSPLSCDSCHGGQAADTTTISSGSHTPHVNTATLALDCDACHNGGLIPTDYSHISDQGTNEGEILYNSAVAVADDALVDVPSEWNDTNNTCSNAACHDPSNQNYLAEWAVSTASCTLCHGDDASMTTNKHGEHLGSGVAINCTDCHIDNGTNDAHLSGAVEVTAGTKISVWANPTCTNSCHNLNGDGGAASWAAANTNPLICSDCHTVGKTGLYDAGATDQGPSSGLHAPSNALNHVTTADGVDAGGDGCEICHNSTPTTSHINGVGPQDSLTATYNAWNASYIDSYANPAGCASSCHSDAVANGGVGKWSRKWIGVSDTAWGAANPGDPKCDNCHGDGMSDGSTLDGNWQAGVAPVHETDWDGDAVANEVLSPLSSHATCQSCHGYGVGDEVVYNTTYTAADGTTEVGHGDSYITMNGPDVVRDAFTGSTAPQGAEYNSAAFGCMAACHTGDYSTGSGDPNEGHVMADSAWPVNYGDFGSGDCDTCHASFGADHTSTNESALMHSSHSGSNYVTSCNNCHPHDGLSVSPGTGVHNDGWVDFNGTTLSTTGDRYSRDAGNYDDTCTNTCHDVDNGTGEWAAQSLGADRCTDCHAATGKLLDQGGYLPTSGEHSEHIAADADYVDDCNSCHGANANTGAHTGHIDNAANITIGGDLTAYDTGNNNCTNNCHTAADVNEWGTGALTCTDCHSSTLSLDAGGDGTFSTAVGPPTGKHDEHMGNSTFVADCANCHTHNGPLDAGVSGHVDGATVATITLNTTVITTYAAANCTNVCHNVDSAVDDGWVNDARTLECNDCHSTTLLLDGGGEADISTSIGPNAGRHDEHMGSAYGYACSDCHGHDGELTVGAHADGSVTAASQLTSYDNVDPGEGTCVNLCHTVTDGADWTAGTATNGIVLACDECHGSTLSLDQGPIAPTSRDHTPHLTSNALPGTEANGEDCYACHDASITSAGSVKNYRADTVNNDHLDTLTTSVTFNSLFNYEATTAGITGNGDAATCSNVRCHNGVTTPTWAAATSISCGQCHNTGGTGPLPSGNTERSHSEHANNDGDFGDCANCHQNANSYSATGGHPDHQNLTVNVNPFDGSTNGGTYTDADGAAGVNYAGDFTDDGTCANSCHGAGPSPFWGNAGSVSCTTCHNDGTDDGNILNAVPSATGGIHDTHNAANNNYVTDDCAACHGAGSNTLAYSSSAKHIDNALGNGVATYNSSKITSYDNATTQTCTNACHNVVDGRDWTSGTALACDDCHGASGKDLYRDRTSGSHAAHYNTASQPVLADYGRTGNVEVADYDFGCGECHPASEATDHLDASVREMANQASTYSGGATGTCGTNACHEDGLGGAPATTPTWGTAFTGDSCNDCHGNWPGTDTSGAVVDATNPHLVHAVGIHFGELYNKTDGGLLTTNTADSSINEVDHSDSNSTTINCNVCHINTVTSSRNRLGSECVTCHTGDAAVTNATIADHTVHVNGTTNVAFLGSIKSKAQLRDNLADADANGGTNLLSEIWSRLTGYKSAANSADTSIVTADAYETKGANTCSNIACHNANDAVWAAPANDCMACHKSVPK